MWVSAQLIVKYNVYCGMHDREICRCRLCLVLADLFSGNCLHPLFPLACLKKKTLFLFCFARTQFEKLSSSPQTRCVLPPYQLTKSGTTFAGVG